MKKKMKKNVMALLAAFVLLCAFLTGCTEVDQVSNNISKEADNFNVTRKLTVLNARTDTILLELKGKYQKDLVYLNDYTMYVVEDISGADVDKYHYEINFLPEWGVKVTHED